MVADKDWAASDKDEAAAFKHDPRLRGSPSSPAPSSNAFDGACPRYRKVVGLVKAKRNRGPRHTSWLVSFLGINAQQPPV